MGLTASVGVGGATNINQAKEHILRLMANMDAEELRSVEDQQNKFELNKCVNRPDEGMVITT